MSSDPLNIQQGLTIPGDELHESFSQSGGSGGQHVNKVATKATLRWNIQASAALSLRQRSRLLERLASRLTRSGELVLQASSSRSQSANREEARARLAGLVREALKVQHKRRPTRPTRASKERRLESKRQLSKRKQGRKKWRDQD